MIPQRLSEPGAARRDRPVRLHLDP